LKKQRLRRGERNRVIIEKRLIKRKIGNEHRKALNLTGDKSVNETPVIPGDRLTC
jgi:hypothetical protein